MLEECKELRLEWELLRPYAGDRRSANSTAVETVQFIFISAEYIVVIGLSDRVSSPLLDAFNVLRFSCR